MRYQLTNSAIMECSICMEQINNQVNKIVTECGHTFHATCLLKNTSINGYGCPMCRSTMVEEYENDDDDEDDDDDDMSYSSDDIREEDFLEEEEYYLRGFRYLFRDAGLDMYEDPDAEEYENYHSNVSTKEEEFQTTAENRTNKIMQHVKKLKTLTYEELIMAALCNVDDSDFQFNTNFHASDKHLFSVRKVEAVLKKVNLTIQQEEGVLIHPVEDGLNNLPPQSNIQSSSEPNFYVPPIRVYPMTPEDISLYDRTSNCDILHTCICPENES